MDEIKQQEGEEHEEGERLNEDIVLDSIAYGYNVQQYEDENVPFGCLPSEILHEHSLYSQKLIEVDYQNFF
jgi:hypothetical protein